MAAVTNQIAVLEAPGVKQTQRCARDILSSSTHVNLSSSGGDGERNKADLSCSNFSAFLSTTESWSAFAVDTN